jgi:prolipoprotein diacylglyceryltransferase
MQQVLVRIPWIQWPIFGFGAMLFVAFLVCSWVAGRRAAREGINPGHVQDLAIWLFVGGLLGARILFLTVEVRPDNFRDFLWQLPRIWDGGIVLYGSVPGALLGYAAFYWTSFRRYRVPTLQLADIIAPSVALGIAFGRLGCFLNGCCYGQVACATCVAYPVHFPASAPPRYQLVREGYQTAAGFTYADDVDQPGGRVRVGRVAPGSPAERAGLRHGDLIEKADGESLAGGPGSPTERLGKHLDLVPTERRGQKELTLTVLDADGKNPHAVRFEPETLGLHPTQLYETVSMFLLFLVLQALYPVRQRQGVVTAVLMMGYAAHRALNELLRADPRPEGVEKYTSYFLFAAGAALAAYALVWGRKVGAEVPAEPPGEDKFLEASAGSHRPAPAR